MSTCIVYPSGKLGDLIWHLPFFKIISKKYNEKVLLITRSSTDAKKLLKNEPYLEDIIYCDFKKGPIKYWKEIIYLKKIFNEKRISNVWILDKNNRPAIAAFLSKSKNVYGYGAGTQKFFISNKKSLSKKDLKTHYISRGKKFMELMGVCANYEEPLIRVSEEQISYIIKKLNLSKKMIICYGVDSREKHRIWSESNFVSLIKKISNNFDAQHCIIADPLNQKTVLNMIKELNTINVLDCSQLTIHELSSLLKFSKIFIGNDSGPYNLSAAVGTISIGISGAVKPLTHSKNFRPVISNKNLKYSKNDRPIDKFGREIKESWLQDTISVDKVYDFFLKNIS